MKNYKFILGLNLTLFFIILGFISLFWTPHNPYILNIENRLQTNNFTYLFGTDSYGRDILSLLMIGIKNSIYIGFISLSISLIFGVFLGLLAAFKRGLIESIILRFIDFNFAFPVLLLAIIFTAIFEPDIINTILATAIGGIPVFMRLTYSLTLNILIKDFILFAKSCGKNNLKLVFNHILPNIYKILLIQATTQISLVILAETTLSYLGLGTQYPDISLGYMINEGQTFIFQSISLLIYPSLTIILLILGLNLLSDSLNSFNK